MNIVKNLEKWASQAFLRSFKGMNPATQMSGISRQLQTRSSPQLQKLMDVFQGVGHKGLNPRMRSNLPGSPFHDQNMRTRLNSLFNIEMGPHGKMSTTLPMHGLGKYTPGFGSRDEALRALFGSGPASTKHLKHTATHPQESMHGLKNFGRKVKGTIEGIPSGALKQVQHLIRGGGSLDEAMKIITGRM